MPNQFIYKRGVPILDEHELLDEDGNVIVKVDRKRLEDIAKKNNARIRDTGDLTPYVVGHTQDGKAEIEQPQIVGYAHHYFVAPFKKTGRYAVHADSMFYRAKKHLVNSHPRRSVELWTDDWKIDPIALLGATTPERDLGLLQLSKSGRRKIRRVLYEKPMPLPQPCQPGTQSQPELGSGDPQVAAIVQSVVSALQETDVWQFLEQQMAEASAMEQEPPMDPGMGQPPLPPEATDQDLYPEGDADGDGLDDEEEYGDDEEGEEEEPVRMSSASMPSGTNTFTPGPTNKRKMSRPTQPAQTRTRRQTQAAPTVPEELVSRIRTAADANRLRYARQERQLATQAEEINRLKYQAVRERREKDLIQLEAEGVILDRVEELDDVMQMPEKFYGKYLAKLRTRYQKAPIGQVRYSAEDYRTGSGGTQEPMSQDRMREIAAYASDNGVSFAEAVKRLDGE